MPVEAYPSDPDLDYVDGVLGAVVEASAQDQVVVARDLRRRNPVCAKVGQARDLVLELVVAEALRIVAWKTPSPSLTTYVGFCDVEGR